MRAGDAMAGRQAGRPAAARSTGYEARACERVGGEREREGEGEREERMRRRAPGGER